MDSITQAALGAVMGELVLGRQIGRRAITWGALFGTLPDLDVILVPLLDTARELRWHRGISHSILFMVLISWLLAKPLARRWKKDKVTPQRAALFVFLAWSTHVLIDVFTVYGTRVFDPFSGYPVSFDNLFIIDPIFTIPLLVAVIIGLFVKPKDWKKGKGLRSAWWCLGISTLYVGLSFWAKHSVSRAVEADLARRGVTWQRRMEAPSAFNIVLWRALVERQGEIWIGYRSVFDPAGLPVRWVIVPKGEAAMERYAEEREVKTVKEFSKGWWIAREAPGGAWLADLRFGEGRTWDERGVALRPSFAWTFEAEAPRDRLHMKRPDSRGGGEMLSRMFRRACGEAEALDAASDGNMMPRLIGNPGVLQEYLTGQR
ncbi:metal-dependent hydrolase [Luteolibacter sp. Populi]|uniref:metal-dependent hydrolase n=1 Tax=Luteolibacter sp. Populi TaxID=3230487 RepID=UPI00346546D4